MKYEKKETKNIKPSQDGGESMKKRYVGHFC